MTVHVTVRLKRGLPSLREGRLVRAFRKSLAARAGRIAMRVSFVRLSRLRSMPLQKRAFGIQYNRCMKLWLIRHAKSDWSSGAARDFDRPLNARGERDAPRMAAWLAGEPDPASWIWSSDAVRASATAAFVARGFAAAGARVVEEHRLYDAGPERLLEVIRETPPDVTSAGLVAHNPGITALVNLLAGATITENLPTFGVARFDVPAPWAELAFGRGKLELITSPKRLPEAEP